MFIPLIGLVMQQLAIGVLAFPWHVCYAILLQRTQLKLLTEAFQKAFSS